MKSGKHFEGVPIAEVGVFSKKFINSIYYLLLVQLVLDVLAILATLVDPA